MSDTAKPFAFSQFVPGFDFLKNLATGGGSGSGSAIPGLSSWVAPTLSVEEVDKRIQELKTVQYWLEQNGHALRATIQALEVQKMTLSTLRGMNVRMEDIASAFTRPAAPAPAASAAVTAVPSFFSKAAPAPAPEPEPEPEVAAAEAEEPVEAPEPAQGAKARKSGKAAEADAAGVVDPLKWWGSLSQQFQQIANSALQDAAQLKMPAVAQPLADAVKSVIGTPAASQKKAPAKKAAPAAKKRATAKKAPSKTSSAARKRPASRR